MSSSKRPARPYSSDELFEIARALLLLDWERVQAVIGGVAVRWGQPELNQVYLASETLLGGPYRIKIRTWAIAQGLAAQPWSYCSVPEDSLLARLVTVLDYRDFIAPAAGIYRTTVHAGERTAHALAAAQATAHRWEEDVARWAVTRLRSKAEYAVRWA